ncbi:hypothetical protein [Paraburkholderia sp. USG1]|uniref:hypothetical protein n=1 Tax=Paraburkholderia sp. USG1 TaxID=2952268 RepID=UPI00386218FA
MGCAEGAFDDAIELLRTGRRARGDALLHERIAESAVELSSAQSLYESVIATLHTAGSEFRALTVGEIRTLRRNRAYLVKLCLKSVGRMLRELRTAGIQSASPIQRHWRDLQVMAAHIDVDWDIAMTEYGAYMLEDQHAPCTNVPYRTI